MKILNPDIIERTKTDNSEAGNVVKIMSCPACKHRYWLPIEQAKYGFKKCPACGFSR